MNVASAGTLAALIQRITVGPKCASLSAYGFGQPLRPEGQAEQQLKNEETKPLSMMKSIKLKKLKLEIPGRRSAGAGSAPLSGPRCMISASSFSSVGVSSESLFSASSTLAFLRGRGIKRETRKRPFVELTGFVFESKLVFGQHTT
jgi:hypothetical protein